MARVSTYINFRGNTEEAFEFYKTVFGTNYIGSIDRYGDIPQDADEAEMKETDKNLVMNVQLPILGGHVLMGTDDVRGNLAPGNNISINLEPDTLAETKELFAKLSEGGTVHTELQLMFWGDYWGQLTDKFGIRWMFNCEDKDSK